MDRYLTKDEVINIPQADLPLAVLSLNQRSFIATAIMVRKKSHYNHFMWMYKPGFFASQGATFALDEITNYLDHHKLKLWHNPDWTSRERATISECVAKDLKKGAIKTRYDWIAIIGQLTGFKWLQNPFTRICSDYADYLMRIDPAYNLKNPAPNDVNAWFKSHPKYQVYGRYLPD